MSDPLDIVLASPGLPHWGGCVREKSLGGSETAAVYVATHLAKLGHHVTAFTPGHQGMRAEGVQWMPIEQFPGYAQSCPSDVVIVSRAFELMRIKFNTKIVCGWVHDLALKRSRGAIASTLWNLDALFVLSEFMRKQYLQIYEGIPESLFTVTRNGVDLASFQGLEQLRRDPKKLLYGSRPERGLETVLNVMDVLGKRGRDLMLHVAWYDNTPPHLEQWYQALWNRAGGMKNVRLLGPLTQPQWHRELATARALLYPGCPGEFREISMIIAMESQAAGTPVVAIRKGALPETLASPAGTLLGDESTEVTTQEYLDQFADAVCQVADHDELFRSMSFAGRQHATMLDWSGVAEQWEADFARRLAERVDDPWRVERHCKRTGELELLEAAA